MALTYTSVIIPYNLHPESSGLLPAYFISGIFEKSKKQIDWSTELRLYRDGSRFVTHFEMPAEKRATTHTRYSVGMQSTVAKIYPRAKKKCQAGILGGVWAGYRFAERFTLVDSITTWNPGYDKPLDAGISLGTVLKSPIKQKNNPWRLKLIVSYGFLDTHRTYLKARTRRYELGGYYIF